MIGIVDTNIIIYYSKGDSKGSFLAQQLEAGRTHYGVSAITEVELFSKANLIDEERLVIEECLQDFIVIPIDSTIARWAGLYRVRYKMSLGDALIAATARTMDLPLWTFNTKDFAKVSGLQLQSPK